MKLRFIGDEKSSYQPNISVDENLDNDGSVVRVKSHTGMEFERITINFRLDLSSITLLIQNDVDGLQVRDKRGQWISGK